MKIKIKLKDLPEHVSKSMKPGISYAIDIIEDEPQEPKRGSYFIVEGRLAYKSTGEECWRYRADENGIAKHENYQLLAALPADWTSLPDLIAQAARAGELEVELAKASRLQADWKATCERERAKNTGLFCELNKLEAQIKQQDAELVDLGENNVALIRKIEAAERSRDMMAKAIAAIEDAVKKV